MSNGHMLVTFGSIDGAAGDTDTIAGQIDSTLDDLKAYLAPMVASWEGAASTDYQALQAKWDTSAEELNTILRQVATTLRTANGNYTETESANASIWAG